jgi:hypothetical protein
MPLRQQKSLPKCFVIKMTIDELAQGLPKVPENAL